MRCVTNSPAVHEAERKVSMIQLRNVEKFFEVGGGKTYALRRINLDVREGEFITIMGPSGAGKSTLLSILGMLDGAWAGEFDFFDQPVHKLNVKQRSEERRV